MSKSTTSTPFIIAIEGIDGSGKDTQAKLLSSFFEKNGRKVIIRSYPQYESFFGARIGTFLSGKDKFASAKDVDPKSMALWYALDRWSDYNNNKEELENSDIIIFNRYTLSSAVYQGLRSPDEKIEDWVFVLEHEKLGLPKPNIYFIFNTLYSLATENVVNKTGRAYVEEKRKDIYEEDSNLQTRALSRYLEIASTRSGFFKINCIDEKGKMLAPAEINANILKALISGGLDFEILP